MYFNIKNYLKSNITILLEKLTKIKFFFIYNILKAYPSYQLEYLKKMQKTLDLFELLIRVELIL